jgi:hypothetical protein
MKIIDEGRGMLRFTVIESGMNKTPINKPRKRV